ncbi:arylamine N-acetyltransferase 1 [Tothia fuscella]|uniref:Arylamine N-acetyltransferase 1 n=1 Tax=Tothia fuscella TaxID=1048955 RepID=A0A9P4NY77_9PEZI|nr:arylamine N-acetyltransferase 1 [Tothia fuscella]
MSNLPKYTKEQIIQYYERIGLPEALRIYDVADISPKAALSYLKELQKHHLISIPFENLALHYSPYKRIVLHPSELHRKIICTTGRGGYCMELNTLFNTLLRSINFTLYATGCRVHDGRDFNGWDHMINIVTIADSRYIVDVGFGSNYVAIQPIRLIHDTTTGGIPNVKPAACRLVFKAVEGGTNKYQKLWCYQHRVDEGEEFRDMFCFSDVEFRARDFEVMNYWTSTSPKVIFTQKVICNKMILGHKEGDANAEGEIVGTLTLTDDLKKRVGAKTEKLKEFESEGERLKALEEHFAISFSEVEKDAIKGTAQEIR